MMQLDCIDIYSLPGFIYFAINDLYYVQLHARYLQSGIWINRKNSPVSCDALSTQNLTPKNSRLHTPGGCTKLRAMPTRGSSEFYPQPSPHEEIRTQMIARGSKPNDVTTIAPKNSTSLTTPIAETHPFLPREGAAVNETGEKPRIAGIPSDTCTIRMCPSGSQAPIPHHHSPPLLPSLPSHHHHHLQKQNTTRES
ncbi:hypothetical protein KC19_2G177600 [Ceratodon purpureus]|uniref:Uncharacterized protein n=1 Tax=Ceratodon purpureus TaxID=3225 RepID=A0A8T0IY34_CERPU|nr:hypothetical protein KC19_2G177600 [Ceratodon purpureus]